ncbi:hypothetical protein GQ53DRAFT_267994 [Thozetella sp. PMI_491]|nr:hypothetical protein GQ53DRAFT_267994 [Thozetella sp. PMI_491]
MEATGLAGQAGLAHTSYSLLFRRDNERVHKRQNHCTALHCTSIHWLFIGTVAQFLASGWVKHSGLRLSGSASLFLSVFPCLSIISISPLSYGLSIIKGWGGVCLPCSCMPSKRTQRRQSAKRKSVKLG